MKQTVAALRHLISSGVHPQNIQIVGDSAGANLALQLISHILHPLKDVAPVTLSSPIRGVYLMSPWVQFISKVEGSMAYNDDSDIMGPERLHSWGRQVLDGVPDSQLPYIEAVKAPEQWFKGINTVVNRILITGGSAECLRDSIEDLAKQICKQHDDTTFWLQDHGVHDDPYFDFFTMEKKLGKMTPQIIDWFATGFKSE